MKEDFVAREGKRLKRGLGVTRGKELIASLNPRRPADSLHDRCWFVGDRDTRGIDRMIE